MKGISMVHRARLALWVSILAAFWAPVAGAQSRWTNHTDTSWIREIVERDGQLYMATAGGLLVYDIQGDSFQRFDRVDGLPSSSLTSLAFDPTGTLYAGTDDIGIVVIRIQGDRLSVQRTLNEQIDGLSNNSVTTLTWWNDRLVYGTRSGAGTVVNGFPLARFSTSSGLPSNSVLDVLPAGQFVWIGTENGAVVADQLDIIRQVPGAPAVAYAFERVNNEVWVGTDSGVERFNESDSSWTNIGPVGFPVFSLYHDGTTMWCGSNVNIFEYAGSGATWNSTSVQGIMNDYVVFPIANIELRSLYVHSNGDVYFGGGQPTLLRGPHLLRWDGAVVDNLLPNQPGGASVTRMSVDLDGSLWASFARFYVGKLMPTGEWVNYNSSIPPSDSLSNPFNNLTCLAASDGVKWFCTLSDAASPKPLDSLDDQLDADYGNDVWQHHDLDSGGGDGLGSLRLQRATEDPAGNLWFLSDEDVNSPGWSGIQIYNKSTGEWLRIDPSRVPAMASGNVSDVAFGASYALVAMRTYGVQRWNHGGYSWSNLTQRPGSWVTLAQLGDEIPAEATVERLALASNGVLWIGTGNGVYRTTDNGGFFSHIGAFTGIGAGLLSTQVNDILLDRNEDLWVGSEAGLNRVSRDDLFDIDSYTTPAQFQVFLQAGIPYSTDIVTPLTQAQVRSLALHPDKDLLYVGTNGGLSEFDFSPSEPTATDLSNVYVYPNPVDGTKGHNELKIENITGPVNVQIYTLEGELVHEESAVTEPGAIVWRLDTASDKQAASGVYIVRITAAGQSIIKRIAVVR